MFGRVRITIALAIAVVSSVVFAASFAAPAGAAGTPDVSLSVDLQPETLHGDTTEVTLTASNATGTDGYNLSYRVVLPAGVTYANGPMTPVVAVDVPNPGETTLFFENVSDLLANNDASLAFTVSHAPGSHTVGSSFSIAADAYVNTDPRLVPHFDPTDGTVTGSTGNDSGSDTTTIAAFRVTKSEPSPEAELRRGLHDQTTVYTITVENNPNAATNDFTIEDWIPAGIEFLACGGGDNSTVVVPPAVIPEEYPGSGPINTPVPANCVAPTIVETVNTGIPSGLPPGVYTHVVWNSTGALGDVDIPAGGSYTFTYAAAIPMQMNTMTWSGPGGVPPTDGSQASNIDNNNGASTQETGTELAFTNRAYATGTYTGDGTTYTHSGETTVTSEDVSLQKTVDRSKIVPGETSTWTVNVNTSEYTAAATGIHVVDTVPDGLKPTSSTPAWDSASENSDGTWTVTWDLADMTADQSTTIKYKTLALTHYRENGGDAAPVLAGDSWENAMTLTASADGRTVTDESSAGQTAGTAQILKEVAVPQTPTAACGDGSALTAWRPDTAGPYGPADRVCWRLTVTGNELHGGDYAVQDYLPRGFTYESWKFGSGNTANEGNIGFDGSGSGSGYLRWYLHSNVHLSPGAVFQVVVSTTVGDPGTHDPGDLTGNLMKFSGTNTPGESFQLRDNAAAEWGEPDLAIAKTATKQAVQGGDTVGFTIAVPNTGNVDALDVEVWDILPAGLECGTVSAISGSGTCNTTADPDRIEWTIPTIAAKGGSVDLTYTVTIPAGVGAGETFTNQTGVRQYETAVNTGTGDRFVYIPSNNIDPTQNASANTDELRSEWTLTTESLGIRKTKKTETQEPGNNRNGQATIGERIDYTVTVTIPQGVTVYDGSLVDDYRETQLEYLPGTATATLNGGSLPTGWNLDDTGGRIVVSYPVTYVNPPGSGDDTLELTFSATVLDVAANTRNLVIRNKAVQRWKDSTGKEQSRNSSSNTRIVEPNLTIQKTNDDADGIVQAGQTIGYELLVTNDNGVQRVSVAHDLVVTDTLPADLDCAVVSSISHGGTCADSNPDVITWNAGTDAALASLDPGAALTLTYTATFPSPIVTNAPFTNTALVTGSSMAGTVVGERDAGSPNGGPGSGYQATDQDTLYAPKTGTTKSVTPAEQTVGEPVRYTVTVRLPRDTVVYDATIIDMLPGGIAVTSSGYTVSTTCDAGSAGSGTSCVPDVVVTELTPNGNDVGWFLGDLLPVSHEERFVTIVYDAIVEDVPAAVDGAVLTNTVNAYGNRSNKLGGITEVPDAPNYDVTGAPATADVTVREPHVVLTKRVLDGATQVDHRRALPNEDLTYEVTLTNDGSWSAYDATVTDTITIPSGDSVSAVSITDGVSNGIAYHVVDGDPTDGALEWAIDGPVPAGQSVTITYTVKVWNATEADENPTGPEISNTADNPSYWAVATHASGDGHREYTGNRDNVAIELDLASIGDYVWFDVNGDGVQDASEQPIPNATVTVTYLGPDGVVGGGDDEVHTTVTDAAGAYLVENLPGGDYTVVVSNVPAGMAPSYDLDDGTSSPDGTWDGVLAENAAKRDVDFGYTGTGSIGDLVWLDRDGDGTQGTDEPGIGSTDVTVTFFGFDGVPGGGDDVVYVVATASDGSYLVDHLPAGNYDVTVTNMPLPNVTPTFDRDGTPDGTTDLTLSAGQDITDADFGYNGDGSVGDTVWFDRDRDGLQGPGEPGIAGVDVLLTWPGPDGVLGTPDDVTFTETTDANGEYLFGGLNSGEYSVVVDVSTLPGGMDNTFDEDGNLNDATELTLAAGEAHLTADFGYGGSGSLGDFVWWDLDGDGVQDSGEPGIPGVDVEVVWAGPDGVLGTGDDVTSVATTDAGGLYLVENLPDGEYRVTVSGSLPSTAANTFDYDGGGDSTAVVTLAGGVPNLDLDFGYVGDNAIGDYVWFDANGDGVQDSTEPALSGVELTLTWAGVDGVFGTADDVSLSPTTTDSAGFYTFPALPDGDYRVDVTGGVPVGMAPTYDEDSGTTSPDQTTTVTGLAGGTNHDTADFGYNGTGTIGDTIFWDLDGDGTQGPGEPGFPNVDVDVTWAGIDGVFGTADDVVYATTTDADGVYVADHLPGGLFRVDVDTTGLPPDATQTADPDGVKDDSSRVNLIAGGVDLDQDFGYRGASSIGDTVWFDVNRDGVQDPGEPGVSGTGVSVTWLGPDGVVGGGDDVVIETTTDADGHYTVPGLVGGAYIVNMDASTLPAGAVPDSDLDGGDATSTAVTLGSGENRTDVDFGVIGSATLSGVVWHDHDGDGVVGPGETGVPNVTVHVTWAGPDGPVTIDVVTDATGSWTLEHLPAGEYTAVIDMATVPPGYVATTPETVNVTLPPSGNESVEHGVVGSAVLGRTVWIDENGNGVPDPGEAGIDGVRVDLIDPSGNVIATTTTANGGEYRFVDLAPGRYTVRLDATTIPSSLQQTFSKTGVLNLETTQSVGEGDTILDVNFGFQKKPQLPVTGSDLARLALLGVLLLIIGGILFAVTRGRKKDSA